MRAMDVMLALPSLLLAIVIVAILGPSLINDLRVGFNLSDDNTINPRTNDESFDMNALGIGEWRIPTDGNRTLTPREHGIPRITGLPFTLQELTNGNIGIHHARFGKLLKEKMDKMEIGLMILNQM